MNSTTTPPIECSCPYCPLVKMRLDVCDVRVFLPKTGTPRITLPDEFMEEIRESSDETIRTKAIEFFERTFTVIALHFRNTAMVRKKGEKATHPGQGYECSFEVIRPNYYKICFHTT